MKAEQVNKPVIILEPSQAEAQWRKGYMQNSPIHHDDESDTGTKFREIFWEALTTV